MKLILRKTWAFIKSYWYVPFMLLLATFSAIFFKKKSINWVGMLDDIRNSHLKEIDAIENIHKAEMMKRDEAFRRMEDARKAIEEEYSRRSMELDANKKKEINRILKKTKDDPKAMAEELEKLTSYRIIIIE